METRLLDCNQRKLPDQKYFAEQVDQSNDFYNKQQQQQRQQNHHLKSLDLLDIERDCERFNLHSVEHNNLLDETFRLKTSCNNQSLLHEFTSGVYGRCLSPTTQNKQLLNRPAKSTNRDQIKSVNNNNKNQGDKRFAINLNTNFATGINQIDNLKFEDNLGERNCKQASWYTSSPLPFALRLPLLESNKVSCVRTHPAILANIKLSAPEPQANHANYIKLCDFNPAAAITSNNNLSKTNGNFHNVALNSIADSENFSNYAKLRQQSTLNRLPTGFTTNNNIANNNNSSQRTPFNNNLSSAELNIDTITHNNNANCTNGQCDLLKHTLPITTRKQAHSVAQLRDETFEVCQLNHCNRNTNIEFVKFPLERETCANSRIFYDQSKEVENVANSSTSIQRHPIFEHNYLQSENSCIIPMSTNEDNQLFYELSHEDDPSMQWVSANSVRMDLY